MKKTTAESFWAKVNKDGPIPEHRPELGPCWIWLGCILKKCGYGQMSFEGAMKYAHILAFFFTFDLGPLNELDHLCRNRACVNPGHLEDVTRQENNRRRIYKRKSHCLRGHEMTPENTVVSQGHHGCKKCRADWRKENGHAA